MITNELNERLITLANTYENEDYFANDPVNFAHAYVDKVDQEIVGFISSWMAYGNRTQIVRTTRKLLEEISKVSSYDPCMFITERQWVDMPHAKDEVLYRFYTYGDFYNLCEALYKIYDKHLTMEEAVLASHDKLPPRLKVPATEWVQAVISLFPNVKGVPQDTKSACKCVCLFLRWMVRCPSPVDLGIWAHIPKRSLLIPLDTHVNRMARQLGLLQATKGANMKAVLELTANCRQIFPDDPTRADYALFGYGITHKNYEDTKKITEKAI